jgi:glutaredoxin-related protein
MSSNTLYQLTVEGTEVVVRFNSELINRDRIVKLLDALEREAIRQQCSRKEENWPTFAQHFDLAQ